MQNKIFKRLKSGLKKTREGLGSLLENITPDSGGLEQETIDTLEETLITSDVGVEFTQKIIDRMEEKAREEGLDDFQDVKALLKNSIVEQLETPSGLSLKQANNTPMMIMLVGINGVGKTTSVGKLAYRFKKDGHKPLICAADTFRAAAVEQLEIWSEEAGVDIVKHKNGGNPGAVVYDAISAAKARNNDYIFVDTAGRLHTKKNLMKEVEKIKRVSEKNLKGAPHEILLVVDATTGQNGLAQAKSFVEYLPITGLILTKLDGTAKGGVVLSIVEELNIPLRYIGVGEGIDDLVDFEPESFTEALLGL